ncbi:MAG: hypothetical protein MJ006_00130 [Methanocorpusculum sp.]|nr:hypothetical protein [Methanocorpusculum sp.]
MNEVIRIKTGTPSLDSGLSGGIPAGSAVLLLSDTGAGGNLLMQTMLCQLTEVSPAESGVSGKLLYISAKKSADVLQNDIKRTLHLTEAETVRAASHLSDAGIPEKGSLQALLEKTAAYPAGSLVFLDSLTSYLPAEGGDPDFYSFFRLMNRMLRIFSERKVTCVFLLAAGALPKEQETQLSDLFDHIWRLSWTTELQKPRRLLSIEKGGDDASASPHEMLQLNAVISSDGKLAVSHLRKIA